MDSEEFIGYLLCVGFFCFMVYLIYTGIRDHFKKSTKSHGPLTFSIVMVRGLLAIQIACLLWFLLWIITFNYVPHGLWGFSGSVVSMIAMLIVDSTRTKK